MYLSFCEVLRCPPLPVTTTLLNRYVAHLSWRLSYKSVRQYLSVLRIISLEVGLPNPLVDNWQLTSLLRGFKREVGDQVCQKAPVTPELLLKLRGHLNLHLSLDRTLWAACLLMFFGLLRKSNVFPPSLSNFVSGKHLARGDFAPTPSHLPPGLLVSLRWSKTIQFKDRTLTIPLPWLRDHPLYPCSALVATFEADPPPRAGGPAFWFDSSSGPRPLTYGVFLSRFKQLLKSAGMDASLFAAHSFRRGGASWAFAQGIPGEIIKIMGDWRSSAYLGYITVPLASKCQAVSRFASALPTHY